MTNKKSVRIAVTADIHFSKASTTDIQSLCSEAGKAADVLAICGDLTDLGRPGEAVDLGKSISAHLKIPCVAVLGNHDYEGDKQDEVKSLLTDAGVKVLDGEACEIDGIGYAGTKGFAGGFDTGARQPWGEGII